MDTKENRTFTHAKEKTALDFFIFLFHSVYWLTGILEKMTIILILIHEYLNIYIFACFTAPGNLAIFCYIYKMNQSYFLHRRYFSSISNWDWLEFCVNNISVEWIHVSYALQFKQPSWKWGFKKDKKNVLSNIVKWQYTCINKEKKQLRRKKEMVFTKEGWIIVFATSSIVVGGGQYRVVWLKCVCHAMPHLSKI